MGQLSKNFTEEELRCPCCGKCDMELLFIERLQRARTLAGIPFPIDSGYRCPKHNSEVGGVEDSAHLRGEAVDIRVQNSFERWTIATSLIVAGFKRIGIGKNFIHCDTEPTKPQKMIWTY